MVRPTWARGFSEPYPSGSVGSLALGTPADGSTARSRGPSTERFEPRKTNFDWLSRDTAEVRKYVDDPLCGFPLSSQSWFDFLHGKSELGSEEQAARIPRTLPIRLISGTHDPVGKDGTGVRKLLEVYRKKGLTVSSQFYDEARHELVNETNRGTVTADLIEWLRQFAG